MTDRDRASGLMLSGLLGDSHLLAFEQIPAAVARHAAVAGVDDVLIHLVDLREHVLRVLPPGRVGGTGPPGRADTGTGDGLSVQGTVAGRAFQYGKVLPAETGTGGGPPHQWWVPLLDGTERLGVLYVSTSRDDDRVARDMEDLASLVAVIVVSKRGFSDAHARLMRTEPLNIAAEMQWHLMQPRTYADDRVVIAASMEPAHQVSGDAFEYAISGDTVHVAVFDAMGHDTSAGLTANLAMAACRNHRREGRPLAVIGEEIERELLEQFGPTRYVTGVLAELDTRTGLLSWVNRGHQQPVVIRGGRWTTHLRCRPAHPMGANLGLPTHVCQEQLEPGDRLVLYTDGITEARRPGGREFGLHRFVDFLVRQHADGLPAPETLRRLTQSILDYHDGQLDDDATVLVLEWHGPAARPGREIADSAGLPDHPGP
ncbi:PP2C family protein-serine/threonine phosphatase [Streptomyces lycii]|nr:PP2C family protein-serine/threonine phosphatase [Streptomyces lycii]